MNSISDRTIGSGAGEPTWDVARLFPLQGSWSVEDYLALDSNHLVEYSDGYLEVLPMPTTSHQLIVLFLYRALETFVAARRLGLVVVAPLRVQLWQEKIREPDLLFCFAKNLRYVGERFGPGPIL